MDMRKIPLGLLAVFLAVSGLAFVAWAAAPGSEIRVTQDGNVSIKRARVMQVAGNNFYTRVSWDNIFIRVTVVTNADTVIVKNHGERAIPADFQEGDLINIEGKFPSASESFIVNATSVKNLSLEKQSAQFSGTVTSVSSESDEFKLSTKSGLITVTTSGARLIKGIIPIVLSQLGKGDRVLSAHGTYDYSTKTLAATDVSVWQDPIVFIPHNFKGTLKSLDGTTLPTSVVVRLTKKDYTVKLTLSSKLTNKLGEATALSRFQVGDTVRFYGAVRNDDLSVVDNVELFRDMSF